MSQLDFKFTADLCIMTAVKLYQSAIAPFIFMHHNSFILSLHVQLMVLFSENLFFGDLGTFTRAF